MSTIINASCIVALEKGYDTPLGEGGARLSVGQKQLLSFARALGEYGSVVFISGNMPMQTEIAPLLIITKLEQFDYGGATAIAVVMLLMSFVLLLTINALALAREVFVPERLHEFAYDDTALPIEEEQTISQPWVVAAICQALALRGAERVLEIGTGSGYSAAVLARLAGEVTDGQARCALGTYPAPGLPDGPVDVIVRPEALEVVVQVWEVDERERRVELLADQDRRIRDPARHHRRKSQHDRRCHARRCENRRDDHFRWGSAFADRCEAIEGRAAIRQTLHQRGDGEAANPRRVENAA